MNYIDHYDRLINRARGRAVEGYCERHHVVPKCMDGGNEPRNIVKLTGEEHYVAHQLLVKIFPAVRWLALAAFRMAQQCTGNKAYGWIRRRKAEELSKAMIGVRRLGRPVSRETREKIAASLRGRKIPRDVVEKMVASKRGKPLTKQHREKISLSNKRTKAIILEKREPRTHCNRGHELTRENIYERPDGSKACRKCRKISKRRFDQARKSALIPK